MGGDVSSGAGAGLAGWNSVLPGGVRRGLLEAIHSVENSVGSGDGERCGLLYWWPTEWSPSSGFVVALCSMEVPNSLTGVARATGFEMQGKYGDSVLSMFEVRARRCVETYCESAGIEFSGVEDSVWIPGVPQIFFGTWHTHPSGVLTASPQDLLGERSFSAWRESAGNFPLGAPSSFVLGLDGAGNVSGVLRYNGHGPMVEWTKSN